MQMTGEIRHRLRAAIGVPIVRLRAGEKPAAANSRLAIFGMPSSLKE
jgi:hypothetical protein